MFEHLERSLELASASWRVLKQHRSLLVLPLIAGVVLAFILTTFVLSTIMDPEWQSVLSRSRRGTGAKPIHYVLLLATYVAGCLVMTFFNIALAIVALARFEGHALSIGQGLGEARSKLPDLLMYALFSATIGTLLHGLEQRFSFAGRIGTRLFGAPWSVAAHLAVPVLAAESVSPGEAVARSLQLVHRCWGDSPVRGIGVGTATAAASALLCTILVTLLFFTFSPLLVLAACAAGIGLVAPLFSALDVVYRVSLYRYATVGETDGFDEHLLSGAFDDD